MKNFVILFLTLPFMISCNSQKPMEENIVYSQPERMEFIFDAKWNNMFNPFAPNASAISLSYDASEDAVKIVTAPFDNYQHLNMPYTFLDLSLKEENKWKSGFQCAVVCMKKSYSASHELHKGTAGGDFKTALYNGASNQWVFGDFIENTDNFAVYKAVCYDPAWGPAFSQGDMITGLRIVPFGTSPDIDGGSVVYLKYIVFFKSEEDANAFLLESGYYDLTAKVNGGGVIQGAGEKSVFKAGETVSLSAVPDPDSGWEFAGWTSEGLTLDSGNTPHISFVMPKGDVSLTAHFKYNFKESTGMDYIMSVVDCNVVVDKNHPGSANNDHGYENGYVIKIADTYHMLMTELFDAKPHPETVGSVPGRVGYWRSSDATHWERLCTIVEGTGKTGDNVIDYADPKNNTWSSSWYWNEEDNRWNIFWRGSYVFRYELPEQFAGVYDLNNINWASYGTMWTFRDVGPDRGSPVPIQGQLQYWDNGTTASFGNVYKVGNLYYSFVGASTWPASDTQWVNGLAWANKIEGPWYRVNTDGHPTFVYSENPFVYSYKNSKGETVYFCVYDDLSNQHSIGYGYSMDGVHWTGKTLDLTGYMDWALNNDFLNSARTPCCLIQEADGSYTIIMTAFTPDPSSMQISKFYAPIVRLNVRIEEAEHPSNSHVVFPGNMRDWQSEGKVTVQYGREYSLGGIDDNDKETNAESRYTLNTYTDITVKAMLRYVDQSWNYNTARAGVYVRSDEKGGGYYAYVTAGNANSANCKVQLYAGKNLLKETTLNKRPAIFGNLTIDVKGNAIKVYYDDVLCLEATDNTYPNAGFVGIDVYQSHWHYGRIEIYETK